MKGKCQCSLTETCSAENEIRDLINLINVYKKEEAEGATTKIEPKTARELVAKLEKLAKKISEICR